MNDSLITDWIVAISGIVTAAGVFFVAWQIILSKKQARVQFEDSLTKEFREIIKTIPIEALLNEDCNQTDKLHAFYNYIDLKMNRYS